MRCFKINDVTIFMRADQMEASWQLLMPVLEGWQVNAPTNFPNYAGQQLRERWSIRLVAITP